MTNCAELRWFRVVVLGCTPDVGQFHQSLWIARCSPEQAKSAAAQALADAGDVLLSLDEFESVEDPIPAHPEVSLTGRAYFANG